MKRFRVFLFALAIVLLFVACDSEQKGWSEFTGEWDFPNAVHISVLQDDNPNEGALDISFSLGEIHYFVTVDGSVIGPVLDGTYVFYQDEIWNDDDREITITLSLHNNKLTVKCEGETPLGGNTFTGGVRQIY